MDAASMDVDIARWILEFLLRQPLDDWIFNALVRILPLSDADSSLKKSLLLRRIESEISNGSVSEKVLELLEYIEELDYRDGIEVSGAMKAAYCGVAVDCTVRFLKCGEIDKKEKFSDVVRRIWEGRVFEMESSENVHLLSEELRSWKDEIDQAVRDSSVCENVLVRNKDNDAVEAVRAYIAEAREIMGPSFLELAAKELSVDSAREVLGFGNYEIREQVRDRAASLPSTGSGLVISESTGEMHEGNLPSRWKKVAPKCYRGGTNGISRGVKISDTDDLAVVKSTTKYDLLRTPEVNKVEELLESSSFELTTVVKDPLSGLLHLAETKISGMAGENVDQDSIPETRDRVGVDAPSPSVAGHVEAVHANEGNLCSPCCGDHQNVTKPSLMAQNSTARTYEWDDSIDGLPEGSPDSWSRLQLPSSKTRIVSALKKYGIRKSVMRRKIKRWSTLEEDTLRTGVHKYGAGNWKAILNSYRDIFEERTEVDLKDKWRNMTRC